MKKNTIGSGKAARFAKMREGFSLVEVVMAVGIVSFALLAIVGLFGTVIGKAGDNAERRSMLEAVDTMRGYLLNNDFTNVYNWAKTGTNEFVFVAYRADDNGNPNKDGKRTLGTWMPANAANTSDYELARVGSWVKARIGVSPANPSGTNLPAQATDYTSGVLAVLVQMDSVAQPVQKLPDVPRIQTTIGVTR
jgi:type II secretory pathway pseudopilin PulG